MDIDRRGGSALHDREATAPARFAHAPGSRRGLALAALAAITALAACGQRASPPISLTASATPVLVAPGATAVIRWSSASATACSSSPGGVSGTSGSFTTPPLAASTTFTITCAGPSGPASQAVRVSVASTPALAKILAAAAAWAATPVRGTPYYYCDCGTGADAGCVAGADTSPGTSPSAPRRTIEDAVARLGALTGTNTVALCKGGAFDLAAGSSGLYVTTTCAPGTTCDDLREYASPVFASDAKPVINNLPGAVSLLRFQGGVGGVRILNIRLQGTNGPYGTANEGIFLYGAHDVKMGNLDLDSFDLPVYDAGGSTGNADNELTGSFITNSQVIGYLGGSDNAVVAYDYWDGNGGSTPLDHTIYLAAEQELSNVTVVGNYIHGQYGPTCRGVVIVGHGLFDGLSISGNTVEIDAAAASGGCYGIGLGSGGYPVPVHFRHTVISGNTLVNTGNTTITVATCPGCTIEDNLVIQDWSYTYPTTGIAVGDPAARATPADDVNDANTIRNNTIWFGPAHVHGALGVQVLNEGTGHVLADNTVTYSADQTVATWGGVVCFDYRLAPGAFAFIDDDHCYSGAAPFAWEKTNGATLAAWRAYSAVSGFDALSISGAPPAFVNAASTGPYDFHPGAGSPLLGAGSPAHAPLDDLTGAPFASPPAIGAFE